MLACMRFEGCRAAAVRSAAALIAAAAAAAMLDACSNCKAASCSTGWDDRGSCKRGMGGDQV